MKITTSQTRIVEYNKDEESEALQLMERLERAGYKRIHVSLEKWLSSSFECVFIFSKDLEI